MARISGVDIPKQKRGIISLTYIFGIRKSRAKSILQKAKVDEEKKVQDWTDDQVGAIRNLLDTEIKVEGALRSEVNGSIRRLIEIGSYRGVRHRKGLPVRGQRTQTNARTRKGKKRTVAGKKK